MQRLRQMFTQLRAETERGASAIILALSAVVILGFVGLAVDLAGAYARTQEVQNAADAAALAAAQSCGRGHDCTMNSARGETLTMATKAATDNLKSGSSTGLENLHLTSNNDDKVTVTVTSAHKNVFASLFGFDTFPVTRTATAQWGLVSAVKPVMPVAVAECEYDWRNMGNGEMVTISLSSSTNPNCVNTPANPFEPPAAKPSGFGYIFDATCNNHTIDLTKGDKNGVWIPRDARSTTPSSTPPNCPTKPLQDLVSKKEVVLLPIFDDCRTIAPETASGCSVPQSRPTPSPTPGFRIVGFAAFEVHAYRFAAGSDHYRPIAINQRPVGCKNTSDRCLHGKFLRWVELDNLPIRSQDVDSTSHGLHTVKLIDDSSPFGPGTPGTPVPDPPCSGMFCHS